jgi:4-amino-4-deoxy-L-arabinose transferase-like glycosyltransferase
MFHPTMQPDASPVSESELRLGREKRKGPADGPTATQLLVVILIYFAAQIVLRTLISNSADLDESDQLIQTQKLSWGYGPQPPVYTWIQIGFIKAFGLSIFSLALLKNLLLFCAYLLTYLNARFITQRHDCGTAAAASLLFIPQIAWESQRDLNHTVLAATLAAATFFCFLRLRTRPDWVRYVVFGLCVGFGLLSKFNYALLFLALVLAALSVPEWRTTVWNARIVVVPAIALVVCLPTGLWILHHRELAFETVYKLHIRQSESLFVVVRTGLASAASATATFFGPMLLIYLVIFRKKTGRRMFNLESDYARLMLGMLLAVYALIAVGIVFFRATELQDRWLQPLLINSPVLLITLLQHHLDRARLKAILFLAATIMVGVSVAIPGRILLAERLYRTEPLNRPYDTLAHQLQQPLADVSMVVVGNRLLGGNLRLSLPDKTYFTPDIAPVFLEPGRSCALAWDTSFTASPPKALIDFAIRYGFGDLTNSSPRYFSATFKYHHTRQMQIGILLPNGK